MQVRQFLSNIFHTIDTQKFRFFGLFFIVVFVSYLFLYFIDFYPEPITEDASTQTDVAEKDEAASTPKPEPEPKVSEQAALPQSIIFDKLNRTVPVLNPASRAVADLDAALLEGVVRHPDSADFADTGNIFILGHSSYLPNVFNKNFQAFNGIQELKWGDTIRLQSIDTEYIYRVDRVYEAKATEVTVPIDSSKERLTLATCDSFGSKDDRFIVEATLVERVAL